MSIPILLPRWPAPSHVRALSTLREGGVSTGAYRSLNLAGHVGDDPAAVCENRRRLQAAHDLPAEPRWLQQVHGVSVADLDAPAVNLTADAAVTRRAGILCAILTADCLPVLLTDVGGECVAAAHAGWRGLAEGVLEATLAAMRTDPSRVLAWLGPAIGPARFEVGAEVRDAFVRRDRAAEAAFVSIPGGPKYFADLGLLARQRLERAGVSQVFGVQECTHAQPQSFFSHRREGRCGRQATMIWKS